MRKEIIHTFILNGGKMDYSKFKDDSFYYFHDPELFEEIVKTLATSQTDEKTGKVTFSLRD